MAPEQAQGLGLDHRADLYSLAAVAYRCLTGTPPVGNGNFTAVVHAVIHLDGDAAATRLGANTVSRWESGRDVQTAAMAILLRRIRDLPG
jgi:hypothetical protein